MSLTLFENTQIVVSPLPMVAHVCRICDGGGNQLMAAPCRCTGSIGWMHPQCLAKWRAEKADPIHCEVCNAPWCDSSDHGTANDPLEQRLRQLLINLLMASGFAIAALIFIVLTATSTHGEKG